MKPKEEVRRPHQPGEVVDRAVPFNISIKRFSPLGHISLRFFSICLLSLRFAISYSKSEKIASWP